MGDLRMSGLLDHLGRPLPSAEVTRWGGSFQDYIDAVQGLQLQPAYTLAGEKQEPVGDSFAAYVQQAYKANGVVFAVSEARKLLLSEAVFKFRHKGEAGGGNDLFDGEDGALDILVTPWPNGTTQDLISRMEQDVTNAGNAFVALSEDGTRLLRRRPDWCEFILTESPLYAVEADVVGVKYTAGGVNSGGPSKLYLIEDVAHWAPIPDPTAEYRGMSWLTPVIKELQADGAATTHKLKFFENAATPNLSVSMKETVTVEQFQAFMAAMDASHKGADNAYKTLYLGGGADVSVVGADMRQLDFKSTQGAGETRIAAAGRVPPIIVGLSEGLSAATYSNYAQARRAFGDSWARPTWRSLCGALSTLVNVPEDATLWYDDRDIAFLREDRKDAAEILSTNMATINAALAAGWVPDSARDAVLAEDLGQLTHSGLLSVQLQPPPDPNATLDPATGLPAADPLLDPAVEEDPALAEDPEALRARVLSGGLDPRVLDYLSDCDPDEVLELLRAWDVRLHPRYSKGRFRKTTSADLVDGTPALTARSASIERRHRAGGYVRDHDGRFADTPGGGSLPALGDKLPKVINGGELTVGASAVRFEAHPGDRVSVDIDGSRVELDRESAMKFEGATYGTGTTFGSADGASALKLSFGADVHDDDAGHADYASLTVVGSGKSVSLSRRELDQLREKFDEVAVSRRVDLASGPTDLYAHDGKFGIRAQVGDSEPVALEFDTKSWARLMAAQNVVDEGFDEMNTFVKGDAAAAVSELTVRTNVGKIRLSRSLPPDVYDPSMTITLAAVDDPAWSITHVADYTDAFQDTRGRIQGALGLEY